MVHPHPISAKARAASAREFLNREAYRLDGKGIILIGGSQREVDLIDEVLGKRINGARVIHNCVCAHHPHDRTHVGAVGCASACPGYEACTYARPGARNVIYTTDFIYYQKPEDIAHLINKHDAITLYADIHVPFLGGAGTRYGGEMQWERLENGMVRCETDDKSRECWVHPDMSWLYHHRSVKIGNDSTSYLCWTPALIGSGDSAGRIVYQFFLDSAPLRFESPEKFTIAGWVAGKCSLPQSVGGNDIAYTSHQIVRGLGFEPAGLGKAVVTVRQIKEVLSHITQRAANHLDIYKQVDEAKIRSAVAARCHGAGVDESATPAIEALILQKIKIDAQWRNASNWVRFNAAYLAWWAVTSTRVWAIFKFISRPFSAVFSSLGALAQSLSGRFVKPVPPAARIEYPSQPVTITPHCVPFVGEASNDDTKLVSTPCPCTRKGGDEAKPRYVLIGISAHPEACYTHCTCSKTLASAFVKRVLAHKHSPTADAAADQLISEMPDLLGVKGRFPINTYDRSEWEARLKRSAAVVMRDAYRSGLPKDLARIGPTRVSSAFVKTEIGIKMLPDSTVADLSTKPRHIMPASTDASMVIGPSSYASSAISKQIFCADSPVFYGSGSNAEVMGEWYDRQTRAGRTVSIKSDFSAFDTSNRLTTGQKIAGAFMWLTGTPEDALHYDYATRADRKSVAKNADHCGGACDVVQSNPGTTSGHYHTTGGNTTLHALIHLKVMRNLYADVFDKRVNREIEVSSGGVERWDHPYRSKQIDEAKTILIKQLNFAKPGSPVVRMVDADALPCAAYVNGDDGLVRVTPTEAERYLVEFERVAKELGYRPEACVAESDAEAEVCSSLPWPTVDDTGNVITVFGPKPGKIICKSGFKKVADGGRHAIALLRGDAIGLSATCGHIPILGRLVAKLLALTRGVAHRVDPEDRYKIRAAASTPYPVIDAAYEMASERYGLDLATIRELEDQIANIERLPAVLHHPAWEVIIRKDA